MKAAVKYQVSIRGKCLIGRAVRERVFPVMREEKGCTGKRVSVMGEKKGGEEKSGKGRGEEGENPEGSRRRALFLGEHSLSHQR